MCHVFPRWPVWPCPYPQASRQAGGPAGGPALQRGARGRPILQCIFGKIQLWRSTVDGLFLTVYSWRFTVNSLLLTVYCWLSTFPSVGLKPCVGWLNFYSCLSHLELSSRSKLVQVAARLPGHLHGRVRPQAGGRGQEADHSHGAENCLPHEGRETC